MRSVPTVEAAQLPGSDYEGELPEQLLTASDLDAFRTSLSIWFVPFMSFLPGMVMPFLGGGSSGLSDTRMTGRFTTERLIEAINSGGLDHALTTAVENVRYAVNAAAEQAREAVAKIAVQLGDPEFGARYEERIYTVKSVLDRCSRQLAEIEDRRA